MEDVGRPGGRLARLDPRPLLADAHPAAALDHDEPGPVGVRVGGDPCLPPEGQLADDAARAALDDLALDPGRAGRAVRAPVADPEPPDVDRHGWRPAPSGGGAGARTWSGSWSRGARSAGASSSAASRAAARRRAKYGGKRRNRIQTSTARPTDERAQDEDEVEPEDPVDDHQAEQDHVRPQDPLVHLEVDRVPVQLPRADVVEDHGRDQHGHRRDQDRHVEIGEVRGVERLEQVFPGPELHASRLRSGRSTGHADGPSEYATEATVYSARRRARPMDRLRNPSRSPTRRGAPDLTNRRRRNRAGACAALGREPRRAVRVRA